MSAPKVPQTPPGRTAYPAVFKATALKPEDKPKYNVTQVYGPDIDLSEVKRVTEAHVKANAAKKWPNLEGVREGKLPKAFTWPWRSGEEKDGKEGFAPDDTFIAFRRNEEFGPPLVVDKLGNPLTEVDVYAGCLSRIGYNPYLYDFAGNVGVALGLEGYQKLGDSDRIGVGKMSADSFDAIEDDELANALA